MNHLLNATLRFILSGILLGLSGLMYAQSFSNNTATNIPDKGSVNVPINVSGLQQSIDTNSFGLQSVSINISHDDLKQIGIELQSPDGHKILLARDILGKDMTNTIFDGTANKYIDFGYGPYNSSNFRPINDLSYLNNGQDPNGTWNLIVTDTFSGIDGKVNSVTLNFSNQPAQPTLSSSNLPIIIINTNGVEIPDDPKIIADMVIIYNGPGEINYINQTNYHYSGKIGIELRGHSSQFMPKKQFGFETLDETGDDDVKVSLLGLPKESDWILSANYSDKSMMRNVLTYQLSREMGNYASRTKYCEVIINNEYKGVFVFQEKIKRDKNRVDVEKLESEDVTEPNITGGYIFSIDKLDGDEIWWRSEMDPKIRFQFVYPKKRKDLTSEQENYLKDYVNLFEQTLNGKDYMDSTNGFRKYIDEVSFMDFLLINELSKNVDGLVYSSYFHKKRGGKLIAGPVWDFDIAWGNADFEDAENPMGFQYVLHSYEIPFWWAKLMSDSKWQTALICRYNNYRSTIFSEQRINEIIDSLANELSNAQVRNFTRWDIIGKHVWPNPTPIPTSFSEEVTKLKDWIGQRLQFLDSEFGACGSGGTVPVQLINFSGTQKENEVVLSWSTSEEKDLLAFEIERSVNNLAFEKMGSVNGNISSSSGNRYSFADETPGTGTNFYRLKIIEQNGNISYSKTISINIRTDQWSIRPNIVGDQLNIYSPLDGSEKVSLKIFNFQGQLVKSQAVSNNSLIKWDVRNLPGGNYILSVQDAQGNSRSMKFTKR